MGVYTYIAFDSVGNYSDSVQFEITGHPTTTTPTLTPEPVIAVSPDKAPIGEEFTFTGSHFTSHGLIEDWFTDPNQIQHSMGGFQTDSSGGFTRRHSWAGGWPPGTYVYQAFDFTRLIWVSVEFEMTRQLAHEVYLPMVVQLH